VEAALSEFDYFTRTVIQSAIVNEYDDVIAPVNAINPSTSTGVSTLDLNIPGAADLYRDLEITYLIVKIKVSVTAGTELANVAMVAQVNLALHSLSSNGSLALCGKQ
jgi:hypothetical protein